MPDTPSDPKTSAARFREWIDVIAHGGSTAMRGLLTCGALVVGGLESYAPGVLQGVHVPTDLASVMFLAGIGYFTPDLARTRPREAKP